MEWEGVEGEGGELYLWVQEEVGEELVISVVQQVHDKVPEQVQQVPEQVQVQEELVHDDH